MYHLFKMYNQVFFFGVNESQQTAYNFELFSFCIIWKIWQPIIKISTFFCFLSVCVLDCRCPEIIFV